MAPERKKVLGLVGLCGCTRNSGCASGKCDCFGNSRPCKTSCLCDPRKCKNRGTLDTTDVLKHELELVEHERALCREKIEMIDCKHRDRVAEYELKLVEREKLRRQFHSEMMELKGNIRVFCRVRPAVAADNEGVISYPTSTEDVGRAIDLHCCGANHHFTFDKVFDHAASQQDVFVEISQLVQSALDGYKVCIFAYGQTGSGKTYTMMGRPENPDQKGLIPRSVDQIFQKSRSLEACGWTFAIKVSIIEIYNATVIDLLSWSNSGTGLRTPFSCSTPKTTGWKQNIRTPRTVGHKYLQDHTMVDVCNEREFSSLLRQAAQRRSVGKTLMNEQSSRSHLVITLRINGVHVNTDQQIKGVLNLIDLAGSQRLASSGATGERLQETQAINRSLLSLSAVISALSNKEAGHVPFRDSKLTHFLEPCLKGDNAKILMFVNVSPDPSSAAESLTSLNFAKKVNGCRIRRPVRQTSARPSTSDSSLSCG